MCLVLLLQDLSDSLRTAIKPQKSRWDRFNLHVISSEQDLTTSLPCHQKDFFPDVHLFSYKRFVPPNGDIGDASQFLACFGSDKALTPLSEFRLNKNDKTL